VEPDVVRRIKAAWASIAEVAQLDRFQVIVRERSALCPPGRVGVLVIDDTVTVSVPREEMKPLFETSLADAEPAEAADRAALLDRLPPVSALLGPASLFYPLGPVAAGPLFPAVVQESVEEVNGLQASVSAEELEEGGVNRLTGQVFVLRSAHIPVAVCGYRAWPAGIAHLCVLTHPLHRRAGFGEAVARAALREALAEGRLPQWRARLMPSRNLARKLGLVELGAQVSFQIEL